MVTEGSEEEDGDWLLFGYVIGLEEEWGYFSLSEIGDIRGRSGYPWSAIFGFSLGLSMKCFVVSGHPPRLAGKERKMNDKVQFQTNVPVEVALKYNDGKEVNGQYGDQVLYTRQRSA